MCGIVGFARSRQAGISAASGRIVLTMLEALACRGPDGAGVALIGPDPGPSPDDAWSIRIAGANEPPLDRLAPLGRLIPLPDGSRWDKKAESLRFRFAPNPGVTADDIERALGARRGGLEVLSLGRRLDLVKQVGSPSQLEAAYAVSSWTGPLAIGHTRLSTESRIDLSHSQPFWVHGVPDLATVHNGHVTNYHQLRRRYEQRGVHLLYRQRFRSDRRVSAGPDGARAEPARGARRFGCRSRRSVQLSGRLARGPRRRSRSLRLQTAGAGRDRRLDRGGDRGDRPAPRASRRLFHQSSRLPARPSFTRSSASRLSD